MTGSPGMPSSRLTGPLLPPSRHATLVDALAAAARSGDGLVFVDLHERESRLGWDEVRSRARRCASYLCRLGVVAGDRVALILPTGPGFVDAFFGTLIAGGVPVPLYPPLRIGRFEEYRTSTVGMLAAAGARLVVTDARTRTLLGEVIAAARPELGCRTPEDLTAGSTDGGVGDATVSPDDLALIQFSSGSTSAPRPVALSHRRIMAQCEALRVMMSTSADPPRTGVSWLPLYHDMGLIGCLLGAVTLPGNMVLIAPEHFLVRPALWLRAIARHGAGISAAPNFGYAVAAKRVKDEDLVGLDLSRWRLALCGAEPVSVTALQRFATRFARFGFDSRALLPVYGLAEATLAVTIPTPGRGVRTLANCGAPAAGPGTDALDARGIVAVGGPIAGHELDVLSEDGRPLPAGRLGAIAVRGPSVMTGYFAQPAATAAALRDGWLDTGDLGLVAGGELYVCGRSKDVIVIHGANRHPGDFESCLLEIPGLRAGCAVALGIVPPGGDGEALLILAERARTGSGRVDAAGDAAIVDAVGRSVRERTGVTPHEVVLLPPGSLPRTSSGKQRRAEAKRRYLDGRLAPPARTWASLLRAFAGSAFAFMRLRSSR